LSEYFTIKRDEITAINGSKFIFKGLKHSVSEIKSLEGVDICWVEEAHNISRESLDVLLPTIRKDCSQIFIVYNPDSEQAPVHQDFVINEMYDSLVIKINYDENPFFPDTLRKLMEWDKQYNYEKYQHIWLGQVKAISDTCIFKGKFTVDTFDLPVNKEGEPIPVDFYFGSDWGFSVDPTTLVRCYMHDGNLYIDYEAYGVGVEFEEIPQLFDSIPGSRENIITADSARPDTISYIRNKGFHIKSARKGKNSIEDGIEFLKSFKKIIIHSRCKNTKYEFENYSYKRDKATDEILPIIVDKNNHIIDSLRYATERLRKGINQKVSIPSISA
jgi:phage terminase large subunit